MSLYMWNLISLSNFSNFLPQLLISCYNLCATIILNTSKEFSIQPMTQSYDESSIQYRGRWEIYFWGLHRVYRYFSQKVFLNMPQVNYLLYNLFGWLCYVNSKWLTSKIPSFAYHRVDTKWDQRKSGKTSSFCHSHWNRYKRGPFRHSKRRWQF